MQPHKHAEVIKAWADGAEVQCFSTLDSRWLDVARPMFDQHVAYRIKPAFDEQTDDSTGIVEMSE